jgi:hypothetical protein
MPKKSKILIDGFLNTRPQHFHHNIAAIGQPGAMYLRYGGCGERVGVKLCKALAQRFTQRTLDALDGLFGRKGRDLILQQSEFVSDVMGK